MSGVIFAGKTGRFARLRGWMAALMMRRGLALMRASSDKAAGRRHRSELGWAFLAFLGTSVGTLSAVGTGMVTVALEGNSAAQSFATAGYLYVIGVATSSSLSVRTGFRRDSQTRKWKRRYPVYTYLPFKQGLAWHYALAVGMGLFSTVVFQWAVTVLVRNDKSTGIVSILGWAQHIWPALLAVHLLWSGDDRSRWAGKVMPVVGAIQVVGLCVAVGIIQFGGPLGVKLSWSLGGELSVAIAIGLMVVASMVTAALKRYLKYVKKRERAVFGPELEKFGAREADINTFLAGKVMTYPSLCRLVFCFLAFAVAVAWMGAPRVVSTGVLLFAVVVLTAGCLGNRLSARAFLDGDAGLTGVGAVAGAGSSFVWSWVLLDLPLSWGQFIGSAIALVAAWIAARAAKRNAVVAREVEHEAQTHKEDEASAL